MQRQRSFLVRHDTHAFYRVSANTPPIGYWIWSKVIENLACINYDTNNLLVRARFMMSSSWFSIFFSWHHMIGDYHTIIWRFAMVTSQGKLVWLVHVMWN